VVVPHQTAPSLSYNGITHGFFGSQGGVSSGIFSSLNCTLHKGDLEVNVRQNRELICQAMGIAPMVTLRQVHKADVLIVENETKNGYEKDAMVTNIPELLLAIQTADCAPILLVDPVNKVIGAVHAGWRSATQGIVMNTVVAMQSLGASVANISAAIGPCIQQSSYEVGEDVFASANNPVFFKPSHRLNHYLFDLPGFLLQQLDSCGVINRIALPLDTYTLEDQYFSCRRAAHAQQSSYGGQLSVIGLG
jgi:polyphenol oxidase